MGLYLAAPHMTKIKTNVWGSRIIHHYSKCTKQYIQAELQRVKRPMPSSWTLPCMSHVIFCIRGRHLGFDRFLRFNKCNLFSTIDGFKDKAILWTKSNASYWPKQVMNVIFICSIPQKPLVWLWILAKSEKKVNWAVDCMKSKYFDLYFHNLHMMPSM